MPHMDVEMFKAELDERAPDQPGLVEGVPGFLSLFFGKKRLNIFS